MVIKTEKKKKACPKAACWEAFAKEASCTYAEAE